MPSNWVASERLSLVGSEMCIRDRFWYMTAFLSIILAFMNILPIPALDGGHVLFLIYEIVARRKPSDKFMERAQMVGMFLLFGLLLWANFNDILRFLF